MALETLVNILGIGGTALGIYGQLETAEAQKAAGRYNAQILRQRAQDIDAVIADVEYVGKQQAMDLGVERAGQMGQGRARFAASGVIVGHGSAGNWEAGLQGQISQDLNRLQANINRQVAQLRQTQVATMQEAAFEEWRGETGATASYIGAGGTLLGGIANVASNYNRMNG